MSTDASVSKEFRSERRGLLVRYRHPTPQVAPAVISLSRIDNRRETPLLFLLRSIDFMSAEALISKEFRSKRREHFVRYNFLETNYHNLP